MDREKYIKGIEKALQRISSRDLKDIDVSEIWIETALPKDLIREILKELVGELSQEISILYGGSVKPDNVDELMEEEEIDGVLVGGASLKVDSFVRIYNFSF